MKGCCGGRRIYSAARPVYRFNGMLHNLDLERCAQKGDEQGNL